jgi:putative peptide zinc metalloprotease protein
MKDGAFTDTQWLVQRDGRFIQLTELLYRIAEHIDGQRTLDEIAARVTEATGRGVSANNVRYLVSTKLIPLGIVLLPDGSLAPTVNKDAPRSPLSVNMRMAMIPAKYIEPPSAVLQYLFWPPILIGVLLVTAAMLGWLFVVHGVAGGVHDALYSPGLLLASLAIIIVSTAWHEFGHSSALKYGGGKVRGMGAGLYLVYPAFFTDVTDNYRLGRWARVRTDLGGFYFNFIFAIGLILLYFVTGWQFLLLVVLFICLDIVHQMLPFVRLDGYWTLADLTGIPDFFSQIGAFLRTVLPLPFWKGRKLPAVKPWVKVVFALYILITVPLLLFLLVVTVRSLPRILATGWDSLGQQFAAFSAAQSEGNVLAMLSSGVQAVLLAIPTFGVLFVFYTLLKRLGGAIWRWSQPSTTRRSIAAFGTTVAIVLLAWSWAPDIPLLPGDNQGPAYRAARANFRPIQPTERGTVRDAGIRAPRIAIPITPRAPRQPAVGVDGLTPTTEASPSVESTVTTTTEPGQTATPVETRTATPGSTRTPASSPTPTERPTGTPTATNVPPTVTPEPAAQPTSAPSPPTSTPEASPTTTVTPAPPLPTATEQASPPAEDSAPDDAVSRTAPRTRYHVLGT